MNGDKKFPYNQYKKLLSGAWQTKLRKDSANLTYWFDFARSAPMLEASASMAGHSAALGNAVHNYNHMQLASIGNLLSICAECNVQQPGRPYPKHTRQARQLSTNFKDVTGRRG